MVSIRRCACVALLALGAFAGTMREPAAERHLVGVRLAKDPLAPVYGWIWDWDHERFRFQRVGRSQKLHLRWTDLVDDDARVLRRRFDLELDGEPRRRMVPGHRLYFQTGAPVEGLLVRIDEAGRHWFKSGGYLFPYPKDRIRRVEATPVALRSIYSAEELYLQRLRARPPRGAAEHADLGHFLYDTGDFERAADHYGRALELRPLLGRVLSPRLAEIEEIIADRVLARVLRRARRIAVLDGDYAGGVRLLEQAAEQHPERGRAFLKAADELRDRGEAFVRRRFGRVKHEELKRAIREFLVTRSPTLDEALAWVRTGLPADLRRRVRARLGLDDDEFERLAGMAASGSPHFATYRDGSWIVGDRVKGKRPDPETWWDRYRDVNTRSFFLRAYAAEQLPDLFHVVRVMHHDCTRCGARGMVRKMRFGPALKRDAPAEWWEVCPRCRGVARDRAVAFR